MGGCAQSLTFTSFIVLLVHAPHPSLCLSLVHSTWALHAIAGSSIVHGRQDDIKGVTVTRKATAPCRPASRMGSLHRHQPGRHSDLLPDCISAQEEIWVEPQESGTSTRHPRQIQLLMHIHDLHLIPPSQFAEVLTGRHLSPG